LSSAVILRGKKEFGHAGKLMSFLPKPPSNVPLNDVSSVSNSSSTTLIIPRPYNNDIDAVPFTQWHNNICSKTSVTHPNHSSRTETTITHAKDQKTGTEINKSPYATYSINTVEPEESSEESLSKNPIKTLHRKHGHIPIQHREIIRSTCEFPGCHGKTCIGLCSKPKDNRVIGHVTHSDKVPKSVPLSTTDLQGNPREQRAVFYDETHIANYGVQDIEATKNLQSQNTLETILNHEGK